MAVALSSYIPFPCVSWWAAIAGNDTLLLDGYEHFEKMTYRNRYYLAGANGLLTLSIPLQHGREQRAAMKDVRIDNKTRWHTQQWRTIVSAYRRAPYFDHYEPSLEKLFTQPYEYLIDANIASILWFREQLRLNFNIAFTTEYVPQHPGVNIDLRRNMKRKPRANFPQYYQLFADRIGFQPDLSVLDLLFSEGPHTMAWINKHREILLETL
ncbi:MAG: WbqC family protein [Bacteroidetes bacterium]|nr:WbqC family protein [Bacteroidota bacterium]